MASQELENPAANHLYNYIVGQLNSQKHVRHNDLVEQYNTFSAANANQSFPNWRDTCKQVEDKLLQEKGYKAKHIGNSIIYVDVKPKETQDK